MKSRRVTKLLACVLSVAMCSVPVSASATYKDITGDGETKGQELTTDFDLLKEKVEVTVPTKAEIRVNPLFDGSQSTVEKYRIASKDLVIANKSMDSKKQNGVPVLVTAFGTITKKGDDVRVYYDESQFTPSSSSKTKEVGIQLVSWNRAGTLSVDSTSSNGQFDLNKTANDSISNCTITTAGSRLQFAIAAPAVANKVATPVMGAFAVIGEANENAAWTKEDLNVSLYYNIQATKQDAVAAPSITVPTVVSGSAVSINFADSALDGAVPTNFVIHDEKGRADTPELTIPTSELTWTRDANDTQWTIAIPGDNAALTWYCQERSGKTFDFLVSFSDGRVSKSKIIIP